MITVKFHCSSTMAEGTIDDEVNTVTIKVPLFFKHAPETWFVNLEAQFDFKQLKPRSTKFYWCILLYPLKSLPS